MQKSIAWSLVMLAAAMTVLLAILVIQNARSRVIPELSTPYHAVLMVNGQAFFGRIENLDTQYPLLRDVYYVQSQTNPETKAVTNVLVKRGREWHTPDRMMLNRNHVLLIEPVKQDSQVAKLMDEQNKKR